MFGLNQSQCFVIIENEKSSKDIFLRHNIVLDKLSYETTINSNGWHKKRVGFRAYRCQFNVKIVKRNKLANYNLSPHGLYAVLVFVASLFFYLLDASSV